MLAIFGFHARLVEQFAQGRGSRRFEDARDACAGCIGTHHVRRRTTAEQQAQSIDNDRLAAARLAGQQIQSRMEAHTNAFDNGVIFNNEFEQH